MTIPLILILLAINILPSSYQDPKRVCKKSALAAWKPIPKLRYRCGGAQNDYDEKILKLPARVRAVKALERQLETFNSDAWWQTSTDDLNVCDFRRKPGALTEAEDERFSSNYFTPLFGETHIRIAILPDPCFQTEYSGSNVFILYRKAGRVFVTEAIDGFFTRADNAINIDFANLNNEVIIEISTGSGGLHPTLTNHYFTINPHTNRAVPKNIFLGDNGPTNEITSALLMGDPEDYELPAEAFALNVIVSKSLAREISIYAEDDEGKIDDNSCKLTRTILKWDGQVYR